MEARGARGGREAQARLRRPPARARVGVLRVPREADRRLPRAGEMPLELGKEDVRVRGVGGAAEEGS